MNFLNKMERKFGKYAIRNLPLIIVICFAIGYLLVGFAPEVYLKLYFSPYDIIVGHQYWRLFTWVFSPPGQISFLSLLMLFFYYTFGQSIERGIGTFLFNIYILGGWLMNTLAAFGVSLFYYAKYGNSDEFALWSLQNEGIEMMAFMIYSIFLGFALVYADSMVLFFFVLPMKASWLAYIDMIYLAMEFVNTTNTLSRVSIIAYLVNFLMLFLLIRPHAGRSSRSQRKRQQAYKSQVIEFEHARQMRGRGDAKTITPDGKTIITRHKCAVCGCSELDDPTMDFRFCSKCNGNYEYCSKHLYTHEHVK